MNRIPVGVLVGFLGSGKTTLLNHLLSQNHGRRIAVVVNDFGVVNVDASLVRHTTERLVTMQNGCICCTLREDLLVSLQELSELELDYILIESTGIGEPLPIAQTFYMADLPDKVRLDAIISVVDSEAFWSTWEAVGEAEDEFGKAVEEPLAPLLVDQLEFADIIVLNKADRLAPTELDHLENFIGKLNPNAQIYRADHGVIAAEKLTGTGLYRYDEAPKNPKWDSEWQKPTSEVEEYGFQSFVFQSERPFDYGRFWGFLEAWPEGVLRAKGTVKFQGQPPANISQAGMGLYLEPLLDPVAPLVLATLPREIEQDYQEALESCADINTEIVFIGQGIRRRQAEIASRLEACLV
jgi:G3E family GTPase